MLQLIFQASNNEESSEDEDDDELEGGEDQWGDLGTTSDKLPNKTSAAALIKGIYTIKPVLNVHSNIDKPKVLMTNGSLMKVDSIAEYSS